MRPTYHKPICTLIMLSIILLISSPAQANDKTKNIAIGIGVGLLATGLEMLSKPNSETTVSNEVQPTAVLQNSKTKIKYSQETADVQSNLKDLGFYNGSIDGLKGQQTYRAIEAWRQSVNSEDTGEMDFIERDVLNDRAKTARENNKYKEKKRQNAKSPKQFRKRLEFSYRNYFTENDKMQICSDFQHSPHFLSASIDDDIDNNFKYARKRYQKELEMMPDCYKISDAEVQNIKSNEHDGYKNSHKGKRNETALLLKHRISDADAMARVDGCNALSRRMFLYKAKNETPSCELLNKTFQSIGM